MKRPATLLIDGKPYLWRDLLNLRREQLEQCRRPGQPTLFALKDDRRPMLEAYGWAIRYLIDIK